MDFKILKLLLLLGVVIVQVGCAAAGETPDATTPALDSSSPSEDTSHGWGTNIQAGGR